MTAPYLDDRPRCGQEYTGENTGYTYQCQLRDGHDGDHVDQGVFF